MAQPTIKRKLVIRPAANDPAVLGSFLRKSYVPALLTQMEIWERTDKNMLSYLRSRQNKDSDIVVRWMTGYGLFQGIQSEKRHKIAEEVESFRKKSNAAGLPLKEIALQELLERFQSVDQRMWLSAASKILWCFYPTDTPMYDSFVFRALTVLQWIDKYLIWSDRLSTPPKVSRAVVQGLLSHYQVYSTMIEKIHQGYASLLDEIKYETAVYYPYDIRILDKVLWFMGNEGCPELRIHTIHEAHLSC